jgi:gas vesicle protein
MQDAPGECVSYDKYVTRVYTAGAMPEERSALRLLLMNLNAVMISRQGENKMIHENHEYKYHTNNIFGVLVGMLVGGLAGAVTMLLLAPQSGKDTRIQIRKKGIELRDRTTEMMEDTVAKIRSNANKITFDLRNYGQGFAAERSDHVSEAAQSRKKAIQGS